jgi:hypothetical protein
MTIHSTSRLAFVLLAPCCLRAGTTTIPAPCARASGSRSTPLPCRRRRTRHGDGLDRIPDHDHQLNGLGGEPVREQPGLRPGDGPLASLTYFDGADLIVFVGKKKIDPGGTLVVPQTQSYILPDFRTKALLAINVQMKDDHDNVINQSVLVKVE